MSRHSDAGAIAGLCFLACAAILPLAYVQHWLHLNGVGARVSAVITMTLMALLALPIFVRLWKETP